MDNKQEIENTLKDAAALIHGHLGSDYSLLLSRIDQAIHSMQSHETEGFHTPESTGGGQRGICRHCEKLPTKEGHDGCLDELPKCSVMNACCGHGKDHRAYIQFWDGTTIEGARALAYIEANRTPAETPTQAEGIAKDAERYRWLREADNFPGDEGNGPSLWDQLCELEANDFDEFIDSAMQDRPAPPKEGA